MEKSALLCIYKIRNDQFRTVSITEKTHYIIATGFEVLPSKKVYVNFFHVKHFFKVLLGTLVNDF